MFDIMIIEDDRNVRERLTSMIAWDTLPVRLVCEAEDSDTARELYLLYQPKIIITDINIPIISGLDLAQELQKEDPELRFIVITGYNDFGLVQKTVNIRAVSLLAKPISSEDINGSLRKAITQIETEREQKNSVSALRQIVAQNLPRMQELYIANLLKSGAESSELIRTKLAQLEIPLAGRNMTVALVALHPTSVGQENWESMMFLMRDMLAQKMKENNCGFFSFTDMHFRLNCVISTDRSDLDDFLEDTLVKLHDRMKNVHMATIYAGIGMTVSDPMQLKESYSDALTALNYQCCIENESITHYKNLKRSDIVFHSQEPVYNYLLQQFRSGDLNSIAHTLRKQTQLIASYADDCEKSIRNFFFEYITTLTNEAIRLGISMDQMENYTPAVARLFQKADVEAYISDAMALTEDLSRQLQSRRTSSSNHLIDMAKEYVDAHISDEFMNLDHIANHVGLSRIYFCKLFHQVEGVSFSNYLKNRRVEMAKKLLCTTNMKVFEISTAVGFSNAKYFSFVFKQTVGQTPLEYQKNARA